MQTFLRAAVVLVALAGIGGPDEILAQNTGGPSLLVTPQQLARELKDPNLVLLEVEPRTVEYWDGPSSLIGKAISFLVARVTKREEVMGENKLLRVAKGAPRKKTASTKRASKKTASKRSASKKTATRR